MGGVGHGVFTAFGEAEYAVGKFFLFFVCESVVHSIFVFYMVFSYKTKRGGCWIIALTIFCSHDAYAVRGGWEAAFPWWEDMGMLLEAAGKPPFSWAARREDCGKYLVGLGFLIKFAA